MHNQMQCCVITYYNVAGLYLLVISSPNGDMYVWFILSNNAIVWNVPERYLWYHKDDKEVNGSR